MPNLTASNAITDFSQYYDPSTYWQYGQTSTQAWAAYDPSTVAADFAAYYQQQASAHIQQENAVAQTPNETTAMTQIYNQPNEDLTLIGKFYQEKIERKYRH